MEYTGKFLTEKGKDLAYLLRHDKAAFKAGKIDSNGWRSTKELLDHGFTSQLLDTIVKTNEKKRYEFNEDKTLIRARQGHSIPVDVDLKETTPPDTLYHGTAARLKDVIFEDGLKKMSRLHVHLSEDVETAKTVGLRHAKATREVAVFVINTKKMYEDGIVFYKSNNNVWLTEYVDPKYIKCIGTFII